MRKGECSAVEGRGEEWGLPTRLLTMIKLLRGGREGEKLIIEPGDR